MAQPPKPGTRRLSDLARHVVLPSGVVSTSWPAVRAQCERFGDTFDEWQDGAGRVILGQRADGLYAATVGGIVLSWPRQVAKTFLVGRIVVALCTLFPGTVVIWSAHRTRTSTDSFRNLKSYVTSAKVSHLLDGRPRESNGEQEIRFRNGSSIRFGAREHGFGRGFTAVDIVVMDEAQILTEKALEDMVPATNQGRHPHGALLFYMGTPPRPVDPGEVFAGKRSDALAGGDGETVYIEFSADEDADPDDREQWARANPSYPNRTPLSSMLRMRKNLGSEDSWLREALGIWHSTADLSVIDLDTWALPESEGGLLDELSVAVDDLALGIDVNPERTSASVAVAGHRPDGLLHVELVEQRAGVAWVAPYVADIATRKRLRAVVVDGMSPAASLIDDLAARKVTATVTDARAMAAACGQFVDRTVTHEVRHIGQHQLTYALSVAGRRPLLDGAWGWSRRHSSADITPVVSATLAMWGVECSRARRPRRGRSGGRRVVTAA